MVARGRVRARNNQGVWNGYVLSAVFKWITNKDQLFSTWNSAQCYVAPRTGGEFKEERIHVYVWLSPFAVPLKLSQHC